MRAREFISENNLLNWFGTDSNLRNSDGSPMVLYHGTSKSITKFIPSKTGVTGEGIYLGDSPEVANAYAGDGTGSNVMPVYARGRYMGIMKWSEYVAKFGWKDAKAKAENDGWAGVYDTKFESAVNVWNPANIKSASGNIGKYNNTSNISESNVITEGNSTNLLIIDVQPEYDQFCRPVLAGIQQMVAKSTGKITVVFNDFGGGDTPEQVYAYLAGHSDDGDDDRYYYDEESDEYIERTEKNPLELKLDNTKFIQKEFGFLRSMMDQGVSDRTIIQLLRMMYINKVGDSRDLDYDSLSDEIINDLEQAGFDYDSEGIFVQDWVPVSLLKQLSPFYAMGGGRDECLREIELICNAFNIRFKRIDSLVY